MRGTDEVIAQRTRLGPPSSKPCRTTRAILCQLIGLRSIAGPEVRIHFPPAGRCYGAGGEDGNFVAYINRWSAAMPQPNDLSRSLVALDQDSTIIAVVELSQSSWL